MLVSDLQGFKIKQACIHLCSGCRSLSHHYSLLSPSLSTPPASSFHFLDFSFLPISVTSTGSCSCNSVSFFAPWCHSLPPPTPYVFEPSKSQLPSLSCLSCQLWGCEWLPWKLHPPVMHYIGHWQEPQWQCLCWWKIMLQALLPLPPSCLTTPP